MYNSRSTEEGAIFRERKRSGVSFSECGVTVAESSLKGHMKRHCVRSVTQTREVEIVGGVLVTYVVYFHRVLKTVRCLATVCPAVAHSAGRLRENFM